MNPIMENFGQLIPGSIRLGDETVPQIKSFTHLKKYLRFPPDVLKVRLQMQHVGQRGPLIGMVKYY